MTSIPNKTVQIRTIHLMLLRRQIFNNTPQSESILTVWIFKTDNFECQFLLQSDAVPYGSGGILSWLNTSSKTSLTHSLVCAVQCRLLLCLRSYQFGMAGNSQKQETDFSWKFCRESFNAPYLFSTLEYLNVNSVFCWQHHLFIDIPLQRARRHKLPYLTHVGKWDLWWHFVNNKYLWNGTRVFYKMQNGQPK